ncbi:MAG TPA: tripartite tricarboxylate transporter substrate-binding protein, partial [Caldimonas sp.]
AEVFKQMADIRMTSIPYKGSAPSVAAVLAGETQMVIVDAAAIFTQIRAGKIKGLAVAGPTRLPALPDVPTVDEAGMPAYKMDAWVALFAPAGTPAAVVNKISSEVAAIMQRADARDKLGSALIPVGSTPEELSHALNSDLARYAPLIKSLNMKAD